MTAIKNNEIGIDWLLTRAVKCAQSLSVVRYIRGWLGCQQLIPFRTDRARYI